MIQIHPIFSEIINSHFPGIELRKFPEYHEWENEVSNLENDNPLKVRYDSGERTFVLYDEIKSYNEFES